MNLKVDYEISTCAPEFAQDMYDELAAGFYKTAVRIRDTARALVPVGHLPHPRKASPKHLRDSIRARYSRRRSGLQKLMQFMTASSGYYKDDPAAFVFAGNRRESIYWHYWVEYGTYDSPAHPFMRPAINAGFNPALAETQRSGRRALNKRRRLRRLAKRQVS
jgi:HK97 gp10 family phage protein